MAMDVILPYEKLIKNPLEFNNLLDAKFVRDLLQCFKAQENTTSTTKMKYLVMFQWLLKFLISDVSSPERKEKESNEELLTKDIKRKDVEFEIETVHSSLSKNKGADLLKTKNKAKKKLISKEELDSLLQEIQLKLFDILQYDETKLSNLTIKEIIDIRDSLIAVATIRLGRRSKELMKMNIKEVNDAKILNVENTVYYLIEVLNQKNTKMGEAAPVALTKQEYDVLKIFISQLRPRLTDNESCSVVFPPKSYMNASVTGDLSYSSAYSILQKFKTKSGKKLSSRTIRGSRITNSRMQNISADERNSLAKSMNHSVNTAERYYNYEEISNSVSKTLLLEQQENRQCLNVSEYTVTDSTSAVDVSLSAVANSDVTLESCQIQASSTPKKASKRALSDEPGPSLDETLKKLRTKKIKTTVSETEKNAQLSLVKTKVEEIVRKLYSEGNQCCLVTNKNRITVQPITQAINKSVLKNCTTGQLRAIIEEVVEKVNYLHK